MDDRHQWRARGGHKGDLWAITVVGLPAAVIGGRLGHLLSAPDTYFGPDGSLLRALAIWDGGFSFWGATILGFLSVWVLTRIQGIRFRPLLDSVAPGLILGHVAGAFSDWFDGRLELVTVLTESAWNLIACVVLIIVSKRLRLGYGQVFALYLCLFGLGRILLEALRIGTPPPRTRACSSDCRSTCGRPSSPCSSASAGSSSPACVTAPTRPVSTCTGLGPCCAAIAAESTPSRSMHPISPRRPEPPEPRCLR